MVTREAKDAGIEDEGSAWYKRIWELLDMGMEDMTLWEMIGTIPSNLRGL
jgi:hypothetical protein